MQGHSKEEKYDSIFESTNELLYLHSLILDPGFTGRVLQIQLILDI